MSAGEFCNREVIVADRETTILEAAKLMRWHHVGDVIVTEQRGEEQVPVVNAEGGLAGILTLDDMLEVFAEQLSDMVRLVNNEQIIERERRA